MNSPDADGARDADGHDPRHRRVHGARAGAAARRVDKRADIWAFGVVLYEMLTGRRAFDGDDVSEVLASVLKTDPDLSVLPADVPPSVRRVLRRCLQKDPGSG